MGDAEKRQAIKFGQQLNAARKKRGLESRPADVKPGAVCATVVRDAAVRGQTPACSAKPIHSDGQWSEPDSAPSMPLLPLGVRNRFDPKTHRPRMDDPPFPFGMVARQLTRKEIAARPKAQRALQDEWDGLRAQKGGT